MNRYYQHLCILPPYNNIWAEAIQRGTGSTLPVLLTSNVTIDYQAPLNTYSVGKTDFWDYEYQLFGVNLPPNTGLTGAGLAGNLQYGSNAWSIHGIPITPFNDSNWNTEDPYQLMTVNLFDPNLGQNLDTTYIVAPVSVEIHCDYCHNGSQGTEVAILAKHDEENGTNLVGSQPVLCANCHADNVLGAPGQSGLPAFSLAMHGKHAEEGVTDCYNCHPGHVTQCLRDIHHTNGMGCSDCHGSMTQVAHSIEQGRQPWLQEPVCQTCHSSTHSTEPNTLYRNSRGHGGLYCETCHGSPHVIFPSSQERDNRQNIRLQGFAGVLRDCYVCHQSYPSGPGPHGYNYPTPTPQPTPGVPATSPTGTIILVTLLSCFLLFGIIRKR
jgi:hypothetical protein